MDDTNIVRDPNMVWQISIEEVPDHSGELFQNALEPLVSAVSRQKRNGEWLVRAYTVEQPEPSLILGMISEAAEKAGISPPYVHIELLPQIDWVAQSLQNLNPIKIGRFIIRGSHTPECTNPSTIEIEINAGTAFGTGHHASTKGCLLALGKMTQSPTPKNCLDLGCGAGILSFAVAKLWKTKTMACDIDRNAVQVAKENATMNQVHCLVRCAVSDGFRSPIVRYKGPYDLIMANILFRPLVRLAPSTIYNMSPSGTLIISGILEQQKTAITATYRSLGLYLIRRFSVDGWTTLVMRKPSHTSPIA